MNVITTVGIVFLGTVAVYLLYWGRRWYAHAHKVEQMGVVIANKYAEQYALTRAVTRRTRFAMDALIAEGHTEAAELFENVVSDEVLMKEEYDKQHSQIMVAMAPK